MNRIRARVTSDVALILVVTAGVVASAIVDWTQGDAPASRIPGLAGFVPFTASALLCMGAALRAVDARRSPRWRLVSLVGALLAAALADPTYATLLAVIPLVAIARRASEPERTIAVAASALLLTWLAVTEDSAQQGAEYESILVLAIVMPIVVMFGNALRRSDQALVLEARLARIDERNRLASDMHDSLGHNLLASSIQLRSASASLDRDPAAAASSIDLATHALSEALSEVRLMVDSTRAEGGGFSLERSLSGLVERASTPSLPVSVTIRGDHQRLDAITQIALYRFAQEAVSNVMRHADASAVVVTSEVSNGNAALSVADDGQGFDVLTAPERTGLSNLRHRLASHGGTVEVRSEPGDGTTVTAFVGVSQ